MATIREVLKGLGLVAITSLVLALLPEAWARDTTAILLTLIAAIYIGFALGSQGRLGLPRQIAAAAFFVLLAFLGLWLNWWFLVIGLALHAGWDYLHHGEHGHGVVPGWYVPLCAVYDLALALYVALAYAI